MSAQNDAMLQVQPDELVTSRGILDIAIILFLSVVEYFGSIISQPPPPLLQIFKNLELGRPAIV